MVIAIWAWLFPELRHAGEITSIKKLGLEDASDSGGGSEGLPS